MSFADAFARSFGVTQKAISDFEDREDRKELRESQRQYQQAQLGLATERNQLTRDAQEATADYREQVLAGQEAQREMLADQFDQREARAQREFTDQLGIREQDAATRALQAETANINAQARQDEATRKADEARLLRDAQTISQLAEISQLPVDQQEQYDAFVTNAFESLKGSKALDLNVFMLSDFREYGAEIASAVQKVAAGEDVDLTPPMLAALTDTLDIHNSKLVGQEIDASFSNAPPEIRGGGFKVEDITVADLKQDGTQFGADLAVKVRGPDGEISYYYPKLTDFRGGASQPAKVDFDAALQAMAGRSHMMNEMKANALFVQMVDKQKVEDFGGADKLATSVRTETDRIYKLIGDQNTVANAALSDDTNGIISIGEDVQEILANRQEVQRRVRAQLLYGKSTAGEISDSEAFLDDIRTALRSATIEVPAKGTKRVRSGTAGRNSVASRTKQVSDIVDIDAIDRQTLSRLFHLGENGNFTGPNVPLVLQLLKYQG